MQGLLEANCLKAPSTTAMELEDRWSSLRKACGDVVVYFIFFLSRLLYLAFSANLGLLCTPHPGMGPLV